VRRVVADRWRTATPAWPRRRPEVEQELWGLGIETRPAGDGARGSPFLSIWSGNLQLAPSSSFLSSQDVPFLFHSIPGFLHFFMFKSFGAFDRYMCNSSKMRRISAFSHRSAQYFESM
jgi:hypothetical protein